MATPEMNYGSFRVRQLRVAVLVSVGFYVPVCVFFLAAGRMAAHQLLIVRPSQVVQGNIRASRAPAWERVTSQCMALSAGCEALTKPPDISHRLRFCKVSQLAACCPVNITGRTHYWTSPLAIHQPDQQLHLCINCRPFDRRFVTSCYLQSA